MEINHSYVFQADSDIINDHYSDNPNYLIEFTENVDPIYCVIYSSSNDLYYPNTELAFTESILQKDRFEWYGNRIKFAHKHIFLRDIKKQWYLTGINSSLDSPTKLVDFLKKETEGYKVITVGSSAGGYNSIIVGQALNAERIYSFNGQFELNSLLQTSTEDIDPILFRNANNKNLISFFDTLDHIRDPRSIFYFNSKMSKWDSEQLQHSRNVKLNRICFLTSNHGIPFLKSNLPIVLNLPLQSLLKLSGKTFHPVVFSLKMAGVLGTIKGLESIFKYISKKIYIKIVLKS